MLLVCIMPQRAGLSGEHTTLPKTSSIDTMVRAGALPLLLSLNSICAAFAREGMEFGERGSKARSQAGAH